MPRYRFAWSNLPRWLRVALKAELEFTAKSAEGLRRLYGVRPNDEFIRDNWDFLRSVWLDRDDESREWIVSELKARNLGDTSIRTVTKRGQTRYLATCRNTSGLRRIVLAQFHWRGEPVNTAAKDHLVSVATREATEVAGGDLRSLLTAALTSMSLGATQEADGDLRVELGHGPAFLRVRVRKETPLVHVFTQHEAEIADELQAYRHANEVNLTTPVVKAMVVPPSGYVLAADIPADALSEAELRYALELLDRTTQLFIHQLSMAITSTEDDEA